MTGSTVCANLGSSKLLRCKSVKWPIIKFDDQPENVKNCYYANPK